MTQVNLDQPVPFEIRDFELGSVATNGSMKVILLADKADGSIKRRRAIKGIQMKPAAEVLLPELNQLAGDLLANLSMPAEEIARRMIALTGLIPLVKPQNLEWAMVELNGEGWKVFVDGLNVVITKQDMHP